MINEEIKDRLFVLGKEFSSLKQIHISKMDFR